MLDLPNKTMILKELEYFTEIASNENLSSAAANLALSEAALSLYLSNLERNLGISLFSRHNNRLKITEEGKIYLQTANKMLQIRNDLYRRLETMKGQPRIRIGLASKYSFQVFSRVLAANKSQYSGIDISVLEGRALALISQLDRNLLDFIIVARDKILDPPSCNVKLIRKEPFTLFASPYHPIVQKNSSLFVPVGQKPLIADMALFRNEAFILSPEETSDGIVAREILCRYAPGYYVFCSINDTNAIMEMVKNQIGITIMPASSFLSTSITRELVWCRSDTLYYRYLQLIYRRDHTISTLEKNLITNLQKIYDGEHLENYF